MLFRFKAKTKLHFSSISKNNIGVAGMMAALRAHNERDEHRVLPRKRRSMHAQAGNRPNDGQFGCRS